MPARAPHPGPLAGVGIWLEAPPDDGTPFGDVLARADAAATAAEGAGIGSVWVSESGAGTTGPDAPVVPYEAYSLLGALAVRTRLVHLGVVADRGERRAPSILAKIVTGVDVISHGRAVLSLDGDGGSDSDTERLSEALAVCRAVLVEDHPTYAGRIYAVDDAVNRPAPVQPGGIPLVVFVRGTGPGRRALVDEAARLADALVVDGGADGVRSARMAVDDRNDAGDRPGGPAAVLGRVTAGTPPGAVADAVHDLAAAGATGCLVGIPFPWDPAAVRAVVTAW